MPGWLPLKRDFDHFIEIEDREKSPHRIFFQLAPVYLEIGRDYVEKMFQKKILVQESHVGVLLCSS